MDQEVFTYSINAPVNVVIEFLKTQITVLQARGKLSYLHTAKFQRNDKFIAKIDQGSAYYTTEIYFSPQKDDSTRVEIINQDPEGNPITEPPLAWNQLRSELERSGYTVMARGDKDVVAVIYSYVDSTYKCNFEGWDKR